MNKEKIMVLGAGVYQVPLIQTAKNKGYYTIAVSIPGNYPGFKIADQVAYISTTDYKAIYELAMKEDISAIVTTGTDVAVISVGYVCDKMNLNGLNYNAAYLSTDKSLMKEAFVKGGVKTAEHKTVYSLSEALLAAKTIGYPVMVKIVDKSGSRGITKVDNDKALEEAYYYGKKITNCNYLIVEKFIEGVEIGIDAFVQNGEILLFIPHDKLLFNTARTNIPKGHICPTGVSKTVYDELYKQTSLAIKAIGLDNCAVNLDAFITDKNEIYIIEIAGRCGATGIPEVITRYTGVDYYSVMIENALGNKITEFSDMRDINHYYASSLIFSDKTGVLSNVALKNNKKEDYKCINYSFDCEKGQRVLAAEDGTDRIGMALFEADSFDELLQNIKEFDNNVVIEID